VGLPRDVCKDKMMRSMPNPNVKVLFRDIVQKTSESPSDCQDAYADNRHLGRYAIADGVARSFFPAEWAKLLVDYFCNEYTELNTSLFEIRNWQAWLAPVQQKWESEIRERVSKKAGANAYHLRNSLAQRDPAAAAFVGLQINVANQPSWKAMIIGDSCLFHVRGDQLISYLMQKPSDFGYHPEYFASVDIHNKYEPRFVGGTVQVGDIFILVSDALAKWILSQYESGGNGWQNTLETLTGISKWNDLHRFVDQARRNNQNPLEDDDVALMIISVTEMAEHVVEPFLVPKAPEKIPAFQPSSKRPAPQTNVQYRTPQKQTPVSRDAMRDQVINRRLRQNSLITVLALVFALISFILSSLSLYLYLNTGFSFETPTTAVAPTSQFPNTIRLTPGSAVYSNADLNSTVILLVQSEISGLLLSASIVGTQPWDQVQMDLWVVSSANGLEYARAQDGLVIILNPVNVRINPTTDGNPIGKLSPGFTYQKVTEFTDFSDTKWYQIRLLGFIPRD